jgi:hypothetical protein
MGEFDICNFGYALAFGTILYFLLYGGRRIHNRHKRRNHNNSNDGIGTSDVSNDVPEHLGWGMDKRDRDFVRLALLGSGLALLFCYLKKRKNCHYSEPLSQEDGVYFDGGESWQGGRAVMTPMTSIRPEDMTLESQYARELWENRRRLAEISQRLNQNSAQRYVSKITEPTGVPTGRGTVVIARPGQPGDLDGVASVVSELMSQ